jgi:hypothetical protein
MSKAKTLMVSFLGVSLVFALMVTIIPTLATAETLASFEPGVSLGKPLPDATLKETTAMGVTTIDVVQWNVVSGSTSYGNVQNNTVVITNSTLPVNNTITGPGTFQTTVTVPRWFRRR